MVLRGVVQQRQLQRTVGTVARGLQQRFGLRIQLIWLMPSIGDGCG